MKTLSEFLQTAKTRADVMNGLDVENPQLSLGELYTILDFLCSSGFAKLKWPKGLSDPHSYRGIYSELALEPTSYTTTAEILEKVTSALGKHFTGWKGGEFFMDTTSPVWIAEEGRCGEAMLWMTLIEMFAEALAEGIYQIDA